MSWRPDAHFTWWPAPKIEVDPLSPDRRLRRPTLSLGPDRLFRAALGAALALALLEAAWALLPPASEAQLRLPAGLAAQLAPLGAAWACALAAARALGRGRLAWGAFGAALCLAATGGLLRLLMPSSPTGGDPADYLQLGSAALTLAAATTLPYLRSPGAAGAIGAADAIIVAVSAFCASWSLLLGPLFHTSPSPLLDKLTLLSQPALLAAAAAVTVFQATRLPPGRRCSAGLVASGLVTLAVSGNVMAYLLYVGAAQALGPADALGTAGYGLLGLGALAAGSTRQPTPRVSAFDSAVPYAAVLLAVGAMVVHEFRTGFAFSPVLLVAGCVLALAIGVRQFLASHENARLVQQAQRAEAALRASQAELQLALDDLADKNSQLAAASRLKSEFLANMSHELRTPLTAILGFAEILLEGLDGKLADEQADDVIHIQRSGQALLTMINDILDLSKIEAGRMNVQLRPFELGPLLSEVAAAFKARADTKGLELSIDAVPEPLTAVGDRERTRQVLANLVANAIKFTAEGSVRIGVTARVGHVEIFVEDTGGGVDEEALGFIFDEFRQVDGSPTRRHGGTGLGLAISKKLVELQGGSIGVDSKPGRGSRFWFTLLRAAEPRQSHTSIPREKPAPSDLPGQSRDLILVVDDDPALRGIISRRLEEAGYATCTASGGEGALSAARELQPAAVTLDLVMPDRNGWSVLEELKADRLTRDIPVIVVSVAESRERAMGLGAVDYLSKPFSSEELLAAVGRALPALEGSDILCVDDDPSSIGMVCKALEAAGAEVRVATSGEEALQAVTQRTPDAIFLDLILPSMSGFELAARLRCREALAQVPVIVLSQLDLGPEDLALLGGHVDRFIPKSELRLGDVPATVRQALGSSAQRARA